MCALPYFCICVFIQMVLFVLPFFFFFLNDSFRKWSAVAHFSKAMCDANPAFAAVSCAALCDKTDKTKVLKINCKMTHNILNAILFTGYHFYCENVSEHRTFLFCPSWAKIFISVQHDQTWTQEFWQSANDSAELLDPSSVSVVMLLHMRACVHCIVHFVT